LSLKLGPPTSGFVEFSGSGTVGLTQEGDGARVRDQ
jgi:hypothetical protein